LANSFTAMPWIEEMRRPEAKGFGRAKAIAAAVRAANAAELRDRKQTVAIVIAVVVLGVSIVLATWAIINHWLVHARVP
jgi:hypothetical protein